MEKTYAQINREERDKIAIWKAEGCSIRAIARRLGRNHSTIIRELKRNNPSTSQGYYLPSKAQECASHRKQRAGYRSKMNDPKLRSYVEEHLQLGWSPELIAGRLPHDLIGCFVSHETIYRYIYRETSRLRKYLARRHRIRWKKGHSRKHQRSSIPYRVPIAKRALQVNQRIRFGHWEADMMEGRHAESAALNVLVERKSRMARLTKLKDRKASSTRQAITKQLGLLPKKARLSVTYDNGKENTDHYKINHTLGLRSYFCEPYCSWQKGTVEQTIGLVRRFLPKGRNLTNITPRHIQHIQNLLNHRPRKCLDFATPAEVFRKSGGALPS